MRPARRGFTITELLSALLLMGTFLLIATKVFQSSVKLTHDTQRQATRMTRMDSMIETMRQDAWGASEIGTADERHAVIRSSDGSEISWSFEPNGSVTRSGGRRWLEAGQDLEFVADGAALVVRSKKAVGGVSEVRMVSAVRMLQGGAGAK